MNEESKHKKTWIKWALAALLLIGLIVAIRQLPIGDWLRAFNQQVADWGVWGVGVFILMYAMLAVLFVPGSALTLGAGFAFGLATGMVAVSIASTLGAALSFLISRYAARDLVRRKFAERENVKAVDRAVADKGWKIVALLRLSPVFPYTGLNYILGLTGVKFWHYTIASWAGMLPGTLLYVYIGYLGRAAAETAVEDGSVDALKWVFYGIGFLATLGVTIYITRLASKAVKESTSLEEDA